MSYDSLTREELVDILRRRDSLAGSYGLNWERKDIVQDKALNSDFVGLALEPQLSCGDGPWRNLIIEGDNYDALRNLTTVYAGKVKLLYLDPPYNTGRKDFVYNDSFFDPTDRYRHSTWLEFMVHRLKLARELLAPDGAIFVSIDDNELFNLGLLMNQVFGEQNFVANVIWQKVFSPKNTAAHFSDDHEYILVYAANKAQWKPNPLPRSASLDKSYKNPDKDPRGPWTSGDLAARNYYSEGRYPIQCPSGRKIEGPPAGSYWRVKESKFWELDADKRIWWGKNGSNTPRIKRFLSEVKQGVVPQTLWTYQEVGHTQDAKKQLNDILPKERNEDVFSTPKPLQLMDRILRLGSNPGDLVMDFFAGSGTFAQATLQLNAEGKGDRRFILVSSTEATDDNPDINLCRDICAERVRAAVKGYQSGKGEAIAGLGGDFAYLRAVRVPMHRLEEGLTDEMVWHFALMACDHQLSPGTFPLAMSVRPTDDHMVVYCANTKAATLAQMNDAITKHAGKVAVLTWSPEVVTDALGNMAAHVSIVSVPSDIRRVFRKGSYRAPANFEGQE